MRTTLVVLLVVAFYLAVCVVIWMAARAWP